MSLELVGAPQASVSRGERFVCTARTSGGGCSSVLNRDGCSAGYAFGGGGGVLLS